MPQIRIPLCEAVVIRGPGKAALEKLPMPKPKRGELLLRVESVGICRTDTEVLEGSLGYYKEKIARYPIVPGHEYAGVVARVGAGAGGEFKKGDRVVGECILSRQWRNRQEVGVVNKDGAYATYIAVPATHVHKIPKNLDTKTAALAEPLAVALRGLRRIRGRLKKEASVAVFGAGPLGNLCAQALAHEGYRVSVFDRRKKRLALLKRPIKTATVLKQLDHYDAIVEVTGAQKVLERVLKESRVGAVILLLGFPYGEIRYNFEDVVGGDKIIIGSVGADAEDFDRALKLLPKLNTAPFVQTIFPLKEYKKAWKLLSSGKCFKVMLRP